MNEIIKIQDFKFNEKIIQTVNARALWEYLEGKQEFANWVKDRLVSFKDLSIIYLNFSSASIK